MIHVSWSEPEDAKSPVIEYPEVCTVELDNRVQAARRVLIFSPAPTEPKVSRLRGAIVALIRSFR